MRFFTLISLSSFLLVLLTALACLEPDEVIVNDLITNKLCVQVQHHQEKLGNIDIYVKFNAAVFPGYDDYGSFDKVVRVDANGQACMNNPPEGKHWLIGYGYDPAIEDSVRGSVAVFIEDISFSVDTVMYVSEIH